MEYRKYWTIGMSLLGAIAAIVSQGQLVTIVDIILGAAILGGVTFGVCSTFKSKESSETETISKGPANRIGNFFKTAVTGAPQSDGWYNDPSGLDFWRYFENGQWTIDVRHKHKTTTMDSSPEVFEPTPSDNFSNSLHERIESGPQGLPDTIDGWYQDPSKLHVFRYLHKGNWTDYVSDSSANVGIDKKGDLETTGPYQPQINVNTIPSSEPTFLASSKFGPTTNTESSNTINGVGDLIVHLERLSNLLNEKVITEEEFESLKKTLLG
jgi:hypothetical protein